MTLRSFVPWLYTLFVLALFQLQPVGAQALSQPPQISQLACGSGLTCAGNQINTLDGSPVMSLTGVNTVMSSALSPYQLVSGMSAYETGSHAASTYQPIGSYLTAASLSAYLQSSTAASTYLTQADAVSTYSTPSSVTSQITSGLSGYLTSSAAASTYQTPAQSAALYQPIGAYLTSVPIGAPNTRTFSLATAYQCTNTAKACIATINITTSTSITLGTGTTNTATIVIGSTNGVASGTGTAIAVNSNSVTGAGLSLGFNSTSPVTVAIPIGWFLAIRATSGSPTVSSAFDQPIG